MQNKDLPEDQDHPQQIDLDHDVGSDVEMAYDAHGDTYTSENDVIVYADDDNDDHDDHDNDDDDDVEAFIGRN